MNENFSLRGKPESKFNNYHEFLSVFQDTKEELAETYMKGESQDWINLGAKRKMEGDYDIVFEEEKEKLKEWHRIRTVVYDQYLGSSNDGISRRALNDNYIWARHTANENIRKIDKARSEGKNISEHNENVYSESKANLIDLEKYQNQLFELDQPLPPKIEFKYSLDYNSLIDHASKNFRLTRIDNVKELETPIFHNDLGEVIVKFTWNRSRDLKRVLGITTNGKYIPTYDLSHSQKKFFREAIKDVDYGDPTLQHQIDVNSYDIIVCSMYNIGDKVGKETISGFGYVGTEEEGMMYLEREFIGNYVVALRPSNNRWYFDPILEEKGLL